MKKYLILLTMLFLVSCSSDKLGAVDINDMNEETYTIKSGSNIKIVAKELEEKNLIVSSRAMINYSKSNNLTNIKAGEYIISKSMTPIEMLEKFNSGDVYKGTKIIVQEGLEAVQVANKIEEAGLGSADVFMDLVNNPDLFKDKYDFLNDENIKSLEGYLYPLTYHFKETQSEKEIIEKMLNSFSNVYETELKDKVEKSGKSLSYVVNLASVVEREAGIVSEMPLVASVFENRLDIGMKLQSCATVQYILKERKWILSNEEIAIDSPYNTYMYEGLPITPISSPSLSAMLSVLEHEKTDYLYFLAKLDGTGEQVYAKTYEEHLKNKAKYLK